MPKPGQIHRRVDKSIGELKASANFFNQKFEENKNLFNADTMKVIKNQQPEQGAAIYGGLLKKRKFNYHWNS